MIAFNPVNIYLLIVNDRNTKRCEICSKLIVNTPERRHWRWAGVFIVDFEHISHLALMFLLSTLNMQWATGKNQTCGKRNKGVQPTKTSKMLFLQTYVTATPLHKDLTLFSLADGSSSKSL